MTTVSSTDKYALYIFGDSTSMRLFQGLRPICNGTADPRLQIPTEAVGGYPPDVIGQVCDPTSPLLRIGFMIHWGVARSDGQYHKAWTSHHRAGDTDDSVENIHAALKEFQRRADGEPTKFIFLSNLWDVRRYMDHFEGALAPNVWVSQYAQNLTKVLKHVQRLTRKTDELLVQTCHAPSAAMGAYYVLRLNVAAVQVAKSLGLRVFDEAKVAGDSNCAASYLEDNIHQDNVTSLAEAGALIDTIGASLRLAPSWKVGRVR